MHGCQELQLGRRYRDVTSIERTELDQTTHLVLETRSPRLNKCSNIVKYKVQDELNDDCDGIDTADLMSRSKIFRAYCELQAFRALATAPLDPIFALTPEA